MFGSDHLLTCLLAFDNNLMTESFFFVNIVQWSAFYSVGCTLDGDEKADVLPGRRIRIGIPKACLGTETALVWRSKWAVCFVCFFLLSHLKSTGRREDLGESFGKSWLRWPSFWCLISPFQCIHLIYQTVRSLPSDDANSNIRLRLHVALRSSLPFLLDDVINFVDSAQEVLQHFSKCRIMKSEKNEKKDVKNIWIRPIHTSSQ